MAIVQLNSRPAVPQSRSVAGQFVAIRFATRPVVLFMAMLISGYAAAQAGINEIHVLPRTMPAAPAPAPQTLRANVDLVLVNVTVLNSEGRAVSGLERPNFAVLDDRHPQSLRYVSNQDEPISLVVVLDASASMASRIQEEKKAFTQLINTSNPQDDFGLITVSDQPQVALHFEGSAGDSQGTVNALQPEGSTALWDGMYLGIQQLKNSRCQRKAMVVISDGGDNHSRYTESELKSLLKEADVEVYAIGMFDRFPQRLEERKGPLQLDEVTSVTGGRVFPVHDPVELLRAVTQISHELRNQYVLGYYPSNRSRDGKWRKLNIRLIGAPSQEKLRLYARKGYYAPTE
jgi:Ca-activated chloride channel homolog